MRRLLLLRHGRTEWNLSRRAQGHADVPLDEVGHAQARAVAELVAALRPVRLWSSDLRRAAQTAAYLAEQTGVQVRYDARLREFSVGEGQGLTWEEARARFPHVTGEHSIADRLRGVPGAETHGEVAARIVPAVEEILSLLGPGETGVVVGHGASLRVALAGVLGWDDAVAQTLGVLDNCRWAALDVQPETGRRRLTGYGLGDFASGQGIG